jgi:hypothetical protein
VTNTNLPSAAQRIGRLGRDRRELACNASATATKEEGGSEGPASGITLCSTSIGSISGTRCRSQSGPPFSLALHTFRLQGEAPLNPAGIQVEPPTPPALSWHAATHTKSHASFHAQKPSPRTPPSTPRTSPERWVVATNLQRGEVGEASGVQTAAAHGGSASVLLPGGHSPRPECALRLLLQVHLQALGDAQVCEPPPELAVQRAQVGRQVARHVEDGHALEQSAYLLTDRDGRWRVQHARHVQSVAGSALQALLQNSRRGRGIEVLCSPQRAFCRS